MARKKVVEVPFYRYLWNFYFANKSEIRESYKDLTKKILNWANPGTNPQKKNKNPNAFLRKPQYEAFEIYIFLKEYLDNPHLYDLFLDWSENKGKFCIKNTRLKEQGEDLFAEEEEGKRISSAAVIGPALEQLKNIRQDYANYIFSLTMGTGKTILMAVCIFYEFLLAHKYPKDERFCHNALVLAPDTTVLQSLKEIQTFDKSKVFSKEYAGVLDSFLKFHFLEDDGICLTTMDGSDFNIIISTSQKIILRKKHTENPAATRFFQDSWAELIENNPNADLYQIDDMDLTANQRYTKLTRLKQLGIYVDEAHHAGADLKKAMLDHDSRSKTSLRLTIDLLARELANKDSRVVACYNFTGTPYVDNQLMPEVVYEYGLRAAIDNRYLKNVTVKDFENVKCGTFVHKAIEEFVETHRGNKEHFRRYEGMFPKMALFASTIEELKKELKPAVEKALLDLGISLDSILVNVGDEKETSSDDLREFRLLDTPESEKQFILLVGKGKEGWNCRSLFSVALYREPKSKIFVLQASMRCLRSITQLQQNGTVFLSKENLSILQKELENNFRMSVEDFTRKNAESEEHQVYVRKKVCVKMVERVSRFKVEPKKVGRFTIFDESFNFENYRKTVGEHNLRNLETETFRKEIRSTVDRTFTAYSLVAELSLYLTQHEKDGLLFPPSALWELLENATDGIDKILEKVNYANEILYDLVIPKLFSMLYDVKSEPGEVKIVEKYIAKDPPPGEKYYTVHFANDKFVSDTSAKYSPYNQKNGNGKSFDLSGYGFDSDPEKDFFVRNLTKNNEIRHIWFTGMLTNGQSDFFVHYIDPESHSLRAYYPDFLIEDKNGKFYIVEIKGRHLINAPTTQAKVEYAKQMATESQMEYVFIPDDLADMLLQEYIRRSKISNFEAS